MSVILIKQYREHDNADESNDRLQSEFSDNGIATVVVPADLQVEMVSEMDGLGYGNNLAVIKAYADTKAVRGAAKQLKDDLSTAGIKSIILPADTSIEKIF